MATSNLTHNGTSSPELERRYLVIDIPDGLLEPRRYTPIRQGYLTLESEQEVVVSDAAGHYSMTVQRIDGAEHQEAEVALSQEQFETLWPLTAGARLEKKRYHIDFTQHDIEIDVFDGDLKPLVLVEVEFDDVQESDYFIAPDFAAAEVTCDKAYNNVSLASRGLPETFLRRIRQPE